MAKVEVDKVIKSLRAYTPKGKRTMQVHVVYTAEYAIYVHENLEARHPNGGQAKYLEQPARTEARYMRDLIAISMANKEGLERALMRAGTHLLNVSKELVPVDTGFLKDSGIVVLTP